MLLTPLALTISRVFHNRSDTEHYKFMFDRLQQLAEQVCKVKIEFKAFSKGGNLLAMLSDMEQAAILGVAESILPTVDKSHSGVDVNTPEELIPYFTRLCHVHAKR